MMRPNRRRRLFVVTVTALVIAGCRREPKPAVVETPDIAPLQSDCVAPYLHPIETVTRPATKAASDVAVADLNNDGWPDIVLASGADEATEPLLGLYNERANVSHPPWRSTAGHYVRVRVADLNHDSFLDVVAAAASPRDKNPRVAADVYLNVQGRLPARPTFRFTGFASLALALGDINGDGWLDISLAEFNSAAASNTSHQYVYLNRGGSFDTRQPSWTGTIPTEATLHMFADLDQDGTLDLLAATAAEAWGYVFYGTRSGAEVSLATESAALPSYDAFGWGMSSFAAVGRLDPSHTGLDVVVSFNTDPFSADPTPFVACDTSGRRYVWQSAQTGIGGGLVLADSNGDRRLDLFGAQWVSEKPGGPFRPGPLLAFCGLEGGVLESGTAIGQDEFIAQGIALGDVDRSGLVDASVKIPLEQTPVTLTLPSEHIHRLRRVSYDGTDITAKVAFIPASSWLTVPRQARDGGSLEVEYETSNSLDIVVADRHPQRSNLVPVLLSQPPKPTHTVSSTSAP